MPAYEEPEEQWRTDLRPIGLTRLARSADQPKYLPDLTHPFYHSDDYHEINGGCFDGDEAARAKAQRDFDSSLTDIWASTISPNGVIDMASYDLLITLGDRLHMDARGCYGRERLTSYVELVEEAVETSHAWDPEGGQDVEVLKAYWLKCREIERRWPPELVARGLSRFRLEDL